jgi:hypothetical protein
MHPDYAPKGLSRISVFSCIQVPRIFGMLISSVSRIQYDMGGDGMVNYIYAWGRPVRGSRSGRRSENEAFRLMRADFDQAFAGQSGSGGT